MSIYWNNIIKKSFFVILVTLSIIGCSKNNQENSVLKEKEISINASERARENVDRGGGLLSGITKKQNTFDFSTSNPLWRATIESLDSIPLNTADYSGGVIITDWYSNGSNESIKINVNFVSDELKTSSIQINSFKKICKTVTECNVEKMNDTFNTQIKENIISKAININLKNQSKKN